MGTGNAWKVTGSLWRRCSEPHTTENESGPIRFEREMGTPICVHRLKVYLTFFYKTLRNKIAKEVRRSHTKYLNEVVGGSLQDNPKTFWSCARLMKTENINIPPLKLDGKLHATDPAKATALNSQFKSVFNVEDSSNIPNKGSSPYPDINHLEIGLEGVAKQFNNINPNKASGPDELPARLLKTVSSEIAPLTCTCMQFLFQ